MQRFLPSLLAENSKDYGPFHQRWGSANGAHAGTVHTAEENRATQDQQKGLNSSMAAPQRWQGSVDERR
jgi:hypothetical protein